MYLNDTSADPRQCFFCFLGGSIWDEASGKRHLGGGIWEKASGGGIWEASGAGIWEKASGRRHLGEASGGRHLGGGIWEGSGSALGEASGALAALEAPGVAGMVSFQIMTPRRIKSCFQCVFLKVLLTKYWKRDGRI